MCQLVRLVSPHPFSCPQFLRVGLSLVALSVLQGGRPLAGPQRLPSVELSPYSDTPLTPPALTLHAHLGQAPWVMLPATVLGWGTGCDGACMQVGSRAQGRALACASWQ